MVLALAITFGARAVLEIAWYRFRRPRRASGTWLEKGHHRLGLSRPAFIGTAAALLLAAAALLIVVGERFGITEVVGLITLAVIAVVMIAAATAWGVVWFTWVSKRW